MNNEELLQTADAMRAFAEGRPVQYLSQGLQWEDISNPTWTCSTALYRPKPQPKRVHWSKPEHVPGPVCWLRKISSNLTVCFTERVIVVVAANGIYLPDTATGGVRFLPFNEIGKYEYSTDRVTWQSCEVEEQ